MTRYSDETPGEMKTKPNQENNKPPKQSHPSTKLNAFFFLSLQRNKQTKILPPKPPVREAEAMWGWEGGGQGL